MDEKRENKLYEKARGVDPQKAKVDCCTLPSGNPGEIHYLPRLGIIAGLNPKEEKFPLEFIEKIDGSLSFHYYPSPIGVVATKESEIVLSATGIHVPIELQKKFRNKIIPWQDAKSAGQLISLLTYNDDTFRQGLDLLPGSLTTVLDPCGAIRESMDAFFELPKTITECISEFIPAVYESVDRTAACISGAGSSLSKCKGDCRSGWRGTLCRANCNIAYVADVAWCIANGIIEVMMEAAHTITTCIVVRGLVEGPPQTGDILLFEAESAIGHTIDIATCGYGYSHAALVCGNEIIHAIGEGVVSGPIPTNGDFAIVRLCLADAQNSALCECARDKIGADYDYIEAVTFGTLNDPGREICTMLIMHCLDNIGINRADLGLSGFVSPNDIARTYDLPPGHLL